jgi:AraC-like DNA-binding protein
MTTRPNPTYLWPSAFLLSQAGLSAYILCLYGVDFHLWALQNMPSAFAILEISFWVEGPLLLLYTRSAIYQKMYFKRRDVLLVLPLLIYIGVVLNASLSFEAMHGADFLLFLRSDNIQYYEHIRNTVRAAFGFWAFFTIQSYQSKMASAYSNSEPIDYAWLKLLVIGFIVLRSWDEFYLLVYTLVSKFMADDTIATINFDLLGVLSNYGQLILTSALLFFALSDSRKIPRINKETFESINLPSTQVNYSAEQIIRVTNYMEKNRPFLDNQLKIDELAQLVSLSPKALSNLINREFNVNFFEYVNNHRLKEVKQHLANPEMAEQSIIELAFLAGYNSKSSFNRLFKLDTGQTPSQYRKHALIIANH